MPHKEKESFQEEAAYRKKTASIRQPRKITVRGEENKKESKVLLPLREIISVCESKEKIREIGLETYTRIIVIDLILVKLFEICLMVFPFKEKGFSM